MEKDYQSSALQMFMTTDKLHRKLFESKVSDLGVHRSQHRVLMFLAENKDYSPSQKEIAEKFNISPAAVAVTLKKLENGGYITKTVFDKDNRINNVSITPKAMDVVKKTCAFSAEIEKMAFKDFTDEDLKIFCGYLEKMQRAIEESIEK